MRFITQVHMSPNGNGHEHIQEVTWQEGAQVGRSTVAQMVTFIEGGGVAKVNDGRNPVSVGVVRATPKYIRTHADGEWTNNLLKLPRY